MSTHASSPSTAQRILFTSLFLLAALLIFILQLISNRTRLARKTNRRRRNVLFKRLREEAEAEGKDQQKLEKEGPSEGKTKEKRVIVGFFHPYCNAGGGGERVLFQAVHHLLTIRPDVVCAIYTGDILESETLQLPEDRRKRVREREMEELKSNSKEQNNATKVEILTKCQQRFNIALMPMKDRIAFIPLLSRHMVADKYWSRLTLLGQAFGSGVLATQACGELIPDCWIDTMGYAYAYPVFRLFNLDVPIGAYVHYPMISTDMLRRVKNREAGHTNTGDVASSALRSHAKFIYYQLFAATYRFALRRADVLVANGSWTRDHLNTLLLGSGTSQKIREHYLANAGKPQAAEDGLAGVVGKSKAKGAARIVYPPCDTEDMAGFPLEGRSNLVVSLAQFRPEKEHPTQLRILAALFASHPSRRSDTKLRMMGSCRNAEDEERIESLKALAKGLGIEANVEFVVNAPFADVLKSLAEASVGLSTMVDEHFGINVVEFMAAGLITLSHASAGPLLDIAVPDDEGRRTGYHATDVSSFARSLAEILELPEDEALAMRRRARERARGVFGREAFERSWDEELGERLLRLVK